MSHIERQVAPLLAGMLKYVDTNNNMAILQADQVGWRQRLWMEMFRNSTATSLQYKDLVHGETEKLPEEFMVQMTSYTGQVMFSQLPFSWVIKDTLDNLITHAKTSRRKSLFSVSDYFIICVDEVYSL